MKTLFCGIILVFGFPAIATEKPPAGTVVASDWVGEPQVKTVGRLNVNTASRAELQRVPGLSTVVVEAILAARSGGPIADLEALSLPEESRCHLKTEGPSNFARILQNPLQVLAPAAPRTANIFR